MDRNYTPEPKRSSRWWKEPDENPEKFLDDLLAFYNFSFFEKLLMYL